MTPAKYISTKIMATIGTADNGNGNCGGNRRGGQGRGKNKKILSIKNNNQPWLGTAYRRATSAMRTTKTRGTATTGTLQQEH